MQLKIKDVKTNNIKCFSIIFEKPKGFNFYPGQYIDIKLNVNDQNGNTRAFTLSSSPTENFLMVTTKKGISPYKRFMENLKSGDTIESSHPAGTFTLDESSPAVFIAGGVGITPFRSILKYVSDRKLKVKIALLYSYTDYDFLFKEELEIWKEEKILNFIPFPTLESGHLNEDKGRLFSTLLHNLYPNSIFYLAGPHGFVNEAERILKKQGIDEIDIRYDRFDGY